MSVRSSLLAILDQGPCYGYQLRAEFVRRTGGRWPLNVGQIYTTLERLERDGLVERGAADERGHVYWTVTDAGARAAHAWLASPVARASAPRDDLAIKIALAVSLPGADAAAVVAAERTAAGERAAALGVASGDDFDPADAVAVLVDEALRAHAEADVRYLDRVAAWLDEHPDAAHGWDVSRELPLRGRPVSA